MKKIIASLLLSNAVIAAPASAQDIDLNRVDQLVELIVGAGCSMTNKTATTVLPEAGFDDQNEIQAIVGFLMENGDAEVRDGLLKITSGQCADVETEYDVLKREFFVYMATVDCTISYEESRTAFPEAGFDIKALDYLIEGLMKIEGNAIDYSSEVITVKSEFCS